MANHSLVLTRPKNGRAAQFKRYLSLKKMMKENPEIQAFSSMAEQYVELIEQADMQTAYSFLSKCAMLLPALYAQGMKLPDVEPTDENDKSAATIDSPMGALLKLLGKYDKYSEVFDPVFDKEAINGSLADDLSDIYLDLKHPLTIWEAGDFTDAVWHWRFNITTHCGDHLVDALRVIHRLVNDHMSPEYVNLEQNR